MKTGEKGQIAERAYNIWEQQGRPHGHDLEHWLQAEKEAASAQGEKTATPRAKRATSASSRKTAATRKSSSKMM